MAFWYKRSPGGEDCALHDNVFYMGMVIYGSYFVLFAHFFYRRLYTSGEEVSHEVMTLYMYCLYNTRYIYYWSHAEEIHYIVCMAQ